MLIRTRAPLSYFSITDTGVILNRFVMNHFLKLTLLTYCRFSQDIQLVDRQLPQAIQTILVRKLDRSSQQLLTKNCRNLQAFGANHLAVKRTKADGTNNTLLYGHRLSCAKDISAHITAVEIARS